MTVGPAPRQRRSTAPSRTPWPRPPALANGEPDPASDALLRRRYADDYRLGGYAGAGP